MNVDEFLLSGQWLYTASSNVQRWRYFANDQVLEVQFLDDSMYEYSGVPYDIAHGFYLTASPGRYVWNFLRDRYDYRKIQEGSGKRKKPQVIRVLPPD